jgi:hypothetical protein
MVTEADLQEWFSYHSLTEEQNQQAKLLVQAEQNIQVLIPEIQSFLMTTTLCQQMDTFVASRLDLSIKDLCMEFGRQILKVPPGRNQDLALQYLQIAHAALSEAVWTCSGVALQQGLQATCTARRFAIAANACGMKPIHLMEGR